MTMLQEPLISVVIPVYNRLKYLGQAIDSVVSQTCTNWELIIADDASDSATRDFLNKYKTDERIKIYFGCKNIGLFSNLNRAINYSNGSYIIVLCTDDFLSHDCLENSLKLSKMYPDAGLILSNYDVVDSQGKNLQSSSIYYYNQITAQPLQLLNPDETLPLLLKFASINGNITGMFFKRKLYDKIGGFREQWRHASDWEWIYRAASHSPILMSKTPLATIRSHSEQLSGANFRNLSNSLEVIEMVRILLNDPRISNLDAAPRWALHIMQFHLWFALKFALQGHWREAFTITKAISQVTGFCHTFWAMLRWLPQRWQVYHQKSFSLPPE